VLALELANADRVVFQKIIYGTAHRPAAKYIYQLSVPNNLLHYPSWETALRETEVLVLADTVVPYIIGVKPNHFAQFR
jgi:hypothetical protein